MFGHVRFILLSIILATLSTNISASANTDKVFNSMHYVDWNHEPFNATAYIESAALEANQSAPSISGRNPSAKGVYFCRGKHWGWPCWWQPAVNQCVNVFVPHFSLGPDLYVVCQLFEGKNCILGQRTLVKPGSPAISAIQSWRCIYE